MVLEPRTSSQHEPKSLQAFFSLTHCSLRAATKQWSTKIKASSTKGHYLVASSMTPFDSLLFCKLGIPFLGVCYSCNKSRACNHLAFLDGGLAWPPFVGPLVFFWRFGSPIHWDFLGWAFLVLFGFFSLSKMVTCWSYVSPKLGLGSHRVIGLKT